jgi:hypothetical protein
MLTVTIGHDQDVENPMECSNWKLHSFGRRHSNFKDPEELGLSYRQDFTGRPIITCPGLRRKLNCGTAFFCWYYEHGQRAWGVTGSYTAGLEFRWDGRRYAGLLIYEGNPKNLEREYYARQNLAKYILREYTEWCNGNCYYYSITDENDEWIDSCGGFIGTEHLCEYIGSAVAGQKWELEDDDFSHLISDIEKFASVKNQLV